MDNMFLLGHCASFHPVDSCVFMTVSPFSESVVGGAGTVAAYVFPGGHWTQLSAVYIYRWTLDTIYPWCYAGCHLELGQCQVLFLFPIPFLFSFLLYYLPPILPPHPLAPPLHYIILLLLLPLLEGLIPLV